MSPIPLPTPDELGRMSWQQRDRAVMAARRLVRAYGGTVEADGGTRYRLTKAAKEANAREWAEQVRADARRLAGEA